MSAFFSFASPFVDLFSKFQMANIQNENQEYLMKKQHQYNLDAMNKTNSQNIMNALEAGSIERASKEKAGLNINVDGGFSPIAGATSPGTGAPSAPMPNAPDFATFATLSQQAPLVKAQARKLNADAEAQELENRGTTEENAWYARVIKPSATVDFDDKGNLVLGASVPNEGATADSEMSGELPETGVTSSKLPPSTTKRGVLARKQARKRIEAELADLDAKTYQSLIQKAIAKGQLDDPDVFKALVDAPLWQQEFIYEQINELLSRELLQDRQGQYFISSKNLNVLENEMSDKGIIQGIEKDIESGESVGTIGKKVAKGIVKLAIRKVFGRD